MPTTSFAPEDFSKGGLSNLDGTIRDPHFLLREFERKEGGTATIVSLHVNYEDAEGGDHPWNYQVGDAEYVKIVDEEDGPALEEGPMIQGVSRPYFISPASEAGLFFDALAAIGFDLATLRGGDVSLLDGLGVHVEGKSFDKKKGGTKNVPLPSALLDEPKKGAKKGAVKAKAKAAAADEEDEGDEEDVEELAVSTAVKILSSPKKFISGYDGDGEVEHADLTTAAFLALKGNAQKGAVIKLLKDAKFLKGRDEFVFDAKAKTVTLGE